jgi:hypothetical protein
MSVPDTRKARPAPAVNGAGLGRDADGSRAVGDRTPDRHLQRPDRPPRFRRPPPKVSPPPSTDSSAVSPSPCRFRRAPPVTSAGTSRRTAANLAAGTGCRMCHRSLPAGDLRHRPQARRQKSRQSASGGAQPDGVRVVVDEAALAQRPEGHSRSRTVERPPGGQRQPARRPRTRRRALGRGSGGRRVLDLPVHNPAGAGSGRAEQLIGGRPAGMLGRNSVTPSVSSE